MSNLLKHRPDSVWFALKALLVEGKQLAVTGALSSLSYEHALTALNRWATRVERVLGSFEDQRVGAAFNALTPTLELPTGLAGTIGWTPGRLGAEYSGRVMCRIDFLASLIANEHFYCALPGMPLLPGVDAVTLFNAGVSKPLTVNTSSKAVNAVKGEKVNSPKKIFIVHGRNLKAVAELKKFMNCIGLEVTSFPEAAAAAGPNAIVREIVKNAVSTSAAVVVLFTPDERSQLIPELGQEAEKMQARPNVLYEAGLAMGLNPDRTVFVSIGQSVDIPSDLNGTHFVRLSNEHSGRESLYHKLKAAGCELRQLTGDVFDATISGDFS